MDNGYWDSGRLFFCATEINLAFCPGRIVCICDVFDALVSERPYKKAWTVSEAIEEIRNWSGTHFDPKLAEMFIGLKPKLQAIVDKLS